MRVDKKPFLSNYNGVIKATLLPTDSVPRAGAGGVICGSDPARVFPPAAAPTELQPPRALSASHSCLNMSQDGGQCRIDVSILEAL